MGEVQAGRPLDGLQLRCGGQVHRCGDGNRWNGALIGLHPPQNSSCKLCCSAPAAELAATVASSCRLGLAASTRDLLAAASVQRVAQQLATCALEMRRPLAGG